MSSEDKPAPRSHTDGRPADDVPGSGPQAGAAADAREPGAKRAAVVAFLADATRRPPEPEPEVPSLRPAPTWVDVVAKVILWLFVLVVAVVGGGLYLLMHTSFTMGRPLRRGNKQLLPDTVPGPDWAGQSPPVPGLYPAARRELHALWLEAARAEHASIAAFSQLSLELLAAGAPPALLTETLRAAQDEVEHAKRCFALAQAASGPAGAAHGPAPFPDVLRKDAGAGRGGRARLLERLAVDSLRDGCLGEGHSARVLQAAAERAADPALSRTLHGLSTDEARHAELGWSILAFCLSAGGAEVRAALARAARELKAAPPPAPLGETRADLSQHGFLPPADITEAFERTRDQVLARVAPLLGPAPGEAAKAAGPGRALAKVGRDADAAPSFPA